jgi:hypothetical protein
MTDCRRGQLPLSSEWFFDPDAVEINDETQRASDLRFDLDKDHWFSLVEFGTWWVLPITRTFLDYTPVEGLAHEVAWAPLAKALACR